MTWTRATSRDATTAMTPRCSHNLLVDCIPWQCLCQIRLFLSPIRSPQEQHDKDDSPLKRWRDSQNGNRRWSEQTVGLADSLDDARGNDVVDYCCSRASWTAPSLDWRTVMACKRISSGRSDPTASTTKKNRSGSVSGSKGTAPGWFRSSGYSP